jgi:RimJ/RimL family protein N-acetyltransferase
MIVTPVTLSGKFITLEPLSLDHQEQLSRVGLNAEIWRWTTALIETATDMRTYIETALQSQVAGSALPFAIIEKIQGEVVGSTRFGNIDRDNRRVEIGWTWIAPFWQRTAVNTEAKYLLLQHAFESWRCLRVEFKTDSLNEKSRNALERIGAKQEGILRNHMIVPKGRIRHSVYYSIIDSEWAEIKINLEKKLISYT